MNLIPWKLIILVLSICVSVILRKRQKARVEQRSADERSHISIFHTIEDGIALIFNEVELISLKVAGDLFRRFIEVQIRLADKLDHLILAREKAGLGSRD